MSQASLKSQVFLSYSPFDERHDRGRLSTLCERLTDEVRMETGKESSFWRDRAAIEGGSDWRRKAEQAIEESKVFVAFITPSYLQSTYCRDEWKRFLEKMRQSEGRRCIIPIMYVGDESLMVSLPGSQEMSLQSLDWRELRFEPFTSPLMKEEMHRAAHLISEALEAQND